MTSIKVIQNWIQINNIDILLINRTDEFLNEYIASYAERLKWVSNFSGSAGRLIIEKFKAYIFVDGRYTHQAKREVDTNFFEIKSLAEYWKHLEVYKNDNKILALDPLLHSIREIKKIKKIFVNSGIKLNYLEKNPIDIYWKNQPSYPKSKVFFHDIQYSGETSINKINRIQKILQLNFVNYYLLTSLESIAWILNLRGGDIKYTPLFFSYVIIPQQGKIELFIDKTKLKHLINKVSKTINIHSLNDIENYLSILDSNKNIAFDEDSTTYHFKIICKKNNLNTKHFENPCLNLKSIKNHIEINGAIEANIRDGVSVTNFLYWLKNKIIIKKVNEIKAANYLFNLRKKNNLFHSSAFETISAFGPNAAMPHYSASKDTNLTFVENSVYLVDSGAQYRDGTTDITRTIIIGKPTIEQMDRYTRVLKGHIAIANVNFASGTKGFELDSLARASLKEINCDYDHATGHGIGSFLSVHEGPQRISKSKSQGSAVIQDGMILSNEPGFYKSGEYGIRIENLIICRCSKLNSLYFETISWAPFDVDLISISLLTTSEIEWINNYHINVYKKISPNLNRDQKRWLRLVTLPLYK